MLRVFFLFALCASALAAAPSTPAVVGGIKMPVAPPTGKIVVPDLKLPNLDVAYMSAKSAVPASWGPFGPDAAVGAVALTKTSPNPQGKTGAFDLLLATLSHAIYKGFPKDGAYINVPWNNGCTTLQVYKNMNPAHQAMTLLTWPAQKALVFVFRGSANFDNWKNNVKASLVKCSMGPRNSPGNCGRIHQGFNLIYTKHKDDLVSLFKAALADTGYSDALYITGHSMGAVLANYMSYEVASSYPTTFKKLYTSVIGCPAVGDKDYRAAFQKAYKHQYFQRYHASLDASAKVGAAIKGTASKVGNAVKGAASKVSKLFGRKFLEVKQSTKKGQQQAMLEAGSGAEIVDIVTQIASIIPGYVHVGDDIALDCNKGGSCTIINPASLHHSFGYQEMIRRFHGLPAYSAKCGYSIDAKGKFAFLPVAAPATKL